MRHYVNIGAVGIQRYLARSNRLDGRRAASAALVAATSNLDVDAVVRGLAERNSEAGLIDGVLSLTLPDRARQDEVIDLAITEMRTQLPGAEFQVLDATAPDYLHALADMRKQIEQDQARFDLPAMAEFPGAQACGICALGIAVDTANLGQDDGEKPACADCAMRHSQEQRDLSRIPEQRLADAVGSERVGGFDELSTIDSRDSHLATVYADANKLGRFFSDINERLDAKTIAKVSGAVVDATFEALVSAAQAVRPGRPSQLWILPHIVGGDDVLVTTPALSGWKFAMQFIEHFQRGLATMAENLHLTDVSLPTVSAGIVFTQKNHDFDHVVELAEQSLKQAKSAGAGEQAYLHFHDVVDGGSRPALSVQVLTDHKHHLQRLHDSGQSHRNQLAEAWRAGGEDTARALAKRLGRADAITSFLPGDGPPLIDLPSALSIAKRWSS